MHCVPNRKVLCAECFHGPAEVSSSAIAKVLLACIYCLPLLHMITYTCADDAKLVKSKNVSLTSHSQLYVSNNYITIYVFAISCVSDNVSIVEKHLHFFNHYPAAVS